jgi:alpha-N-arabinofuranosidase
MITTFNSAQELQFLLQNQPPPTHPSSPTHPAKLRSIAVHLDPLNFVHPDEPPISELLYSGFIEHLGRCIYGGIVDDYRDPSPKSLLEEQDVTGDAIDKGRLGWRKDVKEVMGKGELEVPMLRWPGGMSCAASSSPYCDRKVGQADSRQLCL